MNTYRLFYAARAIQRAYGTRRTIKPAKSAIPSADDRSAAIAKLRLSYDKELGAMRAILSLARRTKDCDAADDLKTRAAKHYVRACTIKGQIDELSIPTVYPV